MRQTAFFTGIFFLGVSAFAADPQLMNLVMPNAQVLVGVNVTNASISPFGQYVLNHIGSDDAGLQSFISVTGFDPRRDVSEILIASDAAAPGKPSGLVLAKGTFNVDKLTAGLPQGTHQTVASYGGATLITSSEPNQAYAVGFLGSSVAIAGDIALVKAAIDRSGAVNSVSPQLATRAQALSSTQDAWSVSLASIGSLVPALGDDALKGPAAMTFQLVRNIQASSGGVKFGDNVVITGQAVADTPQNATALADIFRMLSSLASMSAGGGTTGQNPQAAGLAQLLGKVQITTDGSAVNLAASIPETDIESLLKSIGTRTPAAAAKKTRL